MKIKVIIVLIYFVLLNFVVNFEMRLTLPGVIPENDDTYFCAAFRIPNLDSNSYIKSFESTTDSSIVHHMLLFGCRKPFSTNEYYSCEKICDNDNDEKIIYAWANNAEKLVFPDDAGMSVGGKTGITYMVIQVHYLKKRTMKDYAGIVLELTSDIPQRMMNIIRLSSTNGSIPGNIGHAKLDISCKYEGNVKVSVWAFRVHAHTICRSISGFKVTMSNNKIDLIGKANSQWAQTFYRPNSYLEINPGDILMSRCIYDSTERNRTTVIGKTHHDEMCMFYILVISNNIDGNLGFNSCGNNSFKNLWDNVPAYSMDYSDPEPSSDLLLSSINVKPLNVDLGWEVKHSIGEVSSVAIIPSSAEHSSYSLLVLHRSDRNWNENTFNEDVYIGNKDKIKSKTIFQVDPITGKVFRKGGANNFILPHGITVTKDGKYIWVTDVALHQVMRFRLLNQSDQNLMDQNPDIILGERFVPGNDKRHFCKPAKVAVDSKGFIFVADGYCNSRVIWFNPNGTYAAEFTTKDTMIVVHSITIDEDKYGDITKNVIWVVDRENKRIVGFNFDGSVALTSSSTKYSMPIYSIEMNPSNRLLYGIMSDGNNDGKSFLLDYKTNDLTKLWNSDYFFKTPHDMCIAENGNVIFVAELYLKKVIKFSKVDQSQRLINNMVERYSSMYEFVSRLGSKVIGLMVFLTIFFGLVCLLLFQIFSRYYRKDKNLKRYGPRYRNKDGFEPLAESEDVPPPSNHIINKHEV